MKKIILITLLLFISNLFSVESTTEGILFSYNGKAESVLLVGSINEAMDDEIDLAMDAAKKRSVELSESFKD